MKSKHQSIGYFWEDIAKHYLMKQGLKFIHHQYQTKCGEIDLIMQDKEYVVFVEVRYRENAQFGQPEETIHQYKQRRLIKAAMFYYQRHAWMHKLPFRFDVVGILGSKLNHKLTWIPNAFGVK